MRLQGKSYADIAAAGGGILSTVQHTRDASPKTLFNASQKRLDNLLREGVTALEIKSGYGLDLNTELTMLKVARRLSKHYGIPIQNTLLSAHAVPPEFEGNADGYVRYICETILPKAVALSLVDAVDVFCESIGFTVQQTETLFKAAKKYRLPVKMHAEQLTNQGGSLLAAQYSALSVDHLEYLDEKSIQALAKSKTVAVLLPGAFYCLRETQKPPIDLLRRYKIPMAIATDTNPGTSPMPSILLMMNMAATLFGLTLDEIFAGVTKHAARALGMSTTQGNLLLGMPANFAVWEIAHPRDLIYSIQHNRCKMIIRQGIPHRRK
jgi:imidazolonepropionase